MIQGVLTFGEDEYRHSSFDFIQIFLAGLLISLIFFIYLLVPCLTSNKQKNNKDQCGEKTSVELKCEPEEPCNDAKIIESKFLCKKRNRRLRFQKRKKEKTTYTGTSAESKQLSLFLRIEKLFSRQLRHLSSNCWKTFKRKHKSKKHKKRKRIRKNYNKKRRELSRERKNILKAILTKFLYSILFSSSQISKENKINPSIFKPEFTNWIRIPQQFLKVLPVKGLERFFETASTSANVELSDRMRYEWLRFLSFASNRSIPVRPMFLARSGFYSTGSDNNTTCFSCGLNHSWRDGEDPDHVHRSRSPKCLHVSARDPRNIPIHQDATDGRRSVISTEETQRERRRVSDTRSCNHEAKNSEVDCRTGGPDHNVADNTSGSTHSTGRNQFQSRSAATANDNSEILVVPSATSSVTSSANNLSTSLQSRDSLHISQDRAPRVTEEGNIETCSAHQDSTRNNAVTTSSGTSKSTSSPNGVRSPLQSQVSNINSSLGINFDRPRYPAYAVLSVRISSYQGWPGYLTQMPRQMAIAGFFYVGYSDYGRCFFCGGGLRNWERGDDPWVEHARWFPRCTFLRQNKGEDFVQLVQEEYSRASALAAPRGDESSPDRNAESEVNETKKQHIVSRLLEMGYKTDDVECAINECIETEVDYTIEDIVDKLSTTEQEQVSTRQTNHKIQTGDDDSGNDPSTSDLDDLARENQRLRLQRLCRVCEEIDATIAFLPCGHLICCPDCAPAMRRCPLCKEFVRGTIKTYLV